MMTRLRKFLLLLLVAFLGSIGIGVRLYVKSPLDVQNALSVRDLYILQNANKSILPSHSATQQHILRDLTRSSTLRQIKTYNVVKSSTSSSTHGKATTTTPSYRNATTTIPVKLEVPPDCTDKLPIRCFVFTKIEKTGSSTLFAIFARYVQSNQLNILMQTKFVHIDFRRPKGAAWDIGPGKVTHADALINHARYNQEKLDQYVRKGHKHVVIVREPISWFKSAAKYYDYLFGGKTPEQILNSQRTLYAPRAEASGIATWFHLHQLQWLGFDYRMKDNMTAIREHISWVVHKIDVVMLNEQYDASLVVLKRKFGWNYTDIFYRKYIITNSKEAHLSENSTKKLLSAEVNLGEKLLYDKLNETWWAQPELKQDNFWDEVDHFSSLNWDVSTIYCKRVLATNRSYIIPASKWHQTMSLTETICNYLLGIQYIPMMKQLGSYAFGDRYDYNTRLS